MWNGSYGILTLTHSTIAGNSAGGSGGGVANNGTLTLTHSTIAGNSAGGSGGGVGTLRHPHPDPQYHLRQFRRHRRWRVELHGYDSSTFTLTHSTISGNSAGDRGGGVRNYGTLTLTHSTISGNSAGHQGGGVGNDSYYFSYTLFSSTLTLTHSTLRAIPPATSGGGVGMPVQPLTLTHTLLAGNTAPQARSFSTPAW